MLSNRLIARQGDVNWPARSCDLTPCDFFLWGLVESQAYVTKSRTISDLKKEIRCVIVNLAKENCEAVIVNFFDRFTASQQARGGQMNDIIFHT